MGVKIKIGNLEFGVNSAKTHKALPDTGALSTAQPEKRSAQAPVYHRDNTGNYVYELTSPDFARHYKALSGDYSDANLVSLFNEVPEIFAPINEIASRVAAATWELCRDWNDEVDYKNEQFNRLFEKPNPIIADHRTLIWLDCVYELLLGKTFNYFGGVGILGPSLDAVTSWHVWPAHYVNVKYKTPLRLYSATKMSDIVEEYRVADYNGSKPYKPEEVLPIISPSLEIKTGPLDGSGPVSKAHKALVNLMAVYEARGIIYLKQGALGFLVSKKSDDGGTVALSPGEKKEVQQDIQDTYGITGGRSPIGVTNQPVDFVRTALSIKDLEPFTETKADAAAIYACLRVPRHLMPGVDASTYDNQQGDMRSFYDGVIIPMAKRRAQAWTEYFNLRTTDRRYIRPNFDHVAELQEDKKQQADREKTQGETWKQRFDGGVCSLNEWIAAFNGTPGTAELYKKKKYDMTPDELAIINPIVDTLKDKNNVTSTDRSPKTK